MLFLHLCVHIMYREKKGERRWWVTMYVMVVVIGDGVVGECRVLVEGAR